MTTDKPLAGKTALVAGGTANLGRLFAEAIN